MQEFFKQNNDSQGRVILFLVLMVACGYFFHTKYKSKHF